MSERKEGLGGGEEKVKRGELGGWRRERRGGTERHSEEREQERRCGLSSLLRDRCARYYSKHTHTTHTHTHTHTKTHTHTRKHITTIDIGSDWVQMLEFGFISFYGREYITRRK